MAVDIRNTGIPVDSLDCYHTHQCSMEAFFEPAYIRCADVALNNGLQFRMR